MNINEFCVLYRCLVTVGLRHGETWSGGRVPVNGVLWSRFNLKSGFLFVLVYFVGVTSICEEA